ncbi:GNAT family N-acetyltransferase [Staphylococcus saccharolyticus]|uniref:GNAT family acetyltransferase n=1 Tax=Staphylococcus saccharolyticus TaxID=33028 RepID=A0A380H2R2_9STAP|nr:GNAT family N-acetyltransferase [Staphylococcus saccharolyticus]MBL7564892.1 GNAT family N-acetyltransferase [Staphylococcus saccharolyticus]MBL7570844.1 GNAT family N-acetyltransferase [Staphylococcus saccharolyticus]QQB98709.1 GNAT family N-acetyltransferase [Staphylococcus saccharolyticus]QRJ67076.1 GNAT family N-acetyltransferase [Staphylococcus saccharolyticus]RTX97021.1 GNAT family N-acetyltransferase [Staphylococcus saccharolyticus]
MNIVHLKDIIQVKAFIETSSYFSTSYLYKLPQHHENVDTLLKQSIINPGIVALQTGNEIKCLLFAFSYDYNRFKIVGPFITEDFELTQELFKSLFDTLIKNQPEDAVFNFSFEEETQNYKSLIKVIHASYNFTDYYLEAHEDLGSSLNNQTIIEYQQGFYRAFSKLHNMTFKHDAMKPQDIITSLNEHHRLFLFVSEGLLKGYLHLVIDEKRNSAEIKYFSSHSNYRLKGIAFDLLEYALHVAFKFYPLHKVYFKIRSKNNKRVERFNELGFQINSEYKKYKYESRHLHEDF